MNDSLNERDSDERFEDGATALTLQLIKETQAAGWQVSRGIDEQSALDLVLDAIIKVHGKPEDLDPDLVTHFYAISPFEKNGWWYGVAYFASEDAVLDEAAKARILDAFITERDR